MRCNLIDDPWLPISTGGGLAKVSLRRALVDSHQIKDLALGPTLLVAVLRQVLLPVVLDALGAPTGTTDWAERRMAGMLDRTILDRYLDDHLERFNLVDEVAPFAQVAGLRTAKDELKSIAALIPSEPSGNNVPLFGVRTEDDPPRLGWDEAACWLLHAHCWDTAAIKSGAVGDPLVKGGKTTGNPVGSVGRLGIVVPTGRTLFETLLLNLPIAWVDPRPGQREAVDRPQWRRPLVGPSWSARDAEGILDILTWQSRRIRLVPSVDDETGGVVVRSVVLAAGDRLLSIPEYEPHTAWTIVADPKAGEAPQRPRRHRSGRAAWRGLDSLLAARSAEGTVLSSVLFRQIGKLQAEGALEDDFPLGVELVGLEYGNQSAVVENLVHDALPLPVTALRADLQVGETVERLAGDADELVRAINFLEGDLCRARGGEMVPWDKGERASSRLVYRLDGIARRILSGLQREPARLDEAMAAWAEAARQATLDTADELMAQLSPAAFTGREDGGKAYRVPLAEIRFRAGLRNALPELALDGVESARDAMEVVTE